MHSHGSDGFAMAAVWLQRLVVGTTDDLVSAGSLPGALDAYYFSVTFHQLSYPCCQGPGILPTATLFV